MPGTITAAPDVQRECARCDKAAIIRAAIDALEPATIRFGLGQVTSAETIGAMRGALRRLFGVS